MKLNLGSDGTLMGWVSVDLYADCDVRADAAHLPFRDGCFDRVLASHVLEHLDWDDACTAARECARVLSPHGRAMLRGPDCAAPMEDLIRGIAEHGVTYRPGFEHKWRCSLGHLYALMHAAGLVRIDQPDIWPDSSWPWPEASAVACPTSGYSHQQ